MNQDTLLQQLATTKPLMRRNNSFYGHNSKKSTVRKKTVKSNKIESDVVSAYDKLEDEAPEPDLDRDSSCQTLSEAKTHSNSR